MKRKEQLKKLITLLFLVLVLVSCEFDPIFEGERVFRLVIEVSGTVADPGGSLDIEIIPTDGIVDPEGTPWEDVDDEEFTNTVDFQQQYTALVAYKDPPEEFLRFSLGYIFDDAGQSISVLITYEELTPSPWSDAKILFEHFDNNTETEAKTGSASKSLILPPPK